MIARMIGKALRGIRAGDKHLAWNDPALVTVPAGIALSSAAFADGQAMPLRYAGAGLGDNLSPPLNWSGIPDGAAELVLIMQDPDAPLLRPVVHLIATGFSPRAGGLAEGAFNAPASPDIKLGRASFGGAVTLVRDRCRVTVRIATSFSSSPCDRNWPSPPRQICARC